MNAQLKILGSGNAFNEGIRLNSAYVLASDNKNILIDCGFTVPYALQKAEISFNSIDYIFITHYHGDHVAGISAFLLALKYIYPQNKKLVVVGPGNVKTKLAAVLQVLYPGAEELLDTLNLEFINVHFQEKRKYSINELDFEVFPMQHSSEVLPVGYIFNNKKFKIGFTGDTGWHNALEDFLKKIDIAIVECNFAEKLGQAHLSVEELEKNPFVEKYKNQIYLTHLTAESALKAIEKGFHTLKDFEEYSF